EFRDKCVELMGDVPRLEMFARTKTKGWDVFGNEVKGSIDIPLMPEQKTIELAPAQQLDIEEQIARENAA
uniref:hypothetical protein n=1 Tax=Shewanella sp. Shew256 TaxID=1969376 RepID=UPI003F939BBB